MLEVALIALACVLVVYLSATCTTSPPPRPPEPPPIGAVARSLV